MTTTTLKPPRKRLNMEAGLNPLQQTAVYLLWGHALLWLFLLIRWITFSTFNLEALPLELALARWGAGPAYLIYTVLFLIDIFLGFSLQRNMVVARQAGIGRAVLFILLSVLYFIVVRDFYGASIILALSGFLLILLLRHTAWALAYPAAFWLAVFFVAPMLIVLIVSFGQRSRLGTVTYPEFALTNIGAYFDDYLRFFSPIGGEHIYLRIFWRSVGIALLNTVLCLLLAYPFAYWIARRPEKYRSALIFLVMIPFWTNFLVRTYAWMLILRDSGLINNFWTITLHDQAVMLADNSQFFAWLAAITERKLPLLFNQPAVMVGLLYGYFPFMVLPLYSNLEKLDWSLLEAAADLGANAWRSTLRILVPLSMPGIVSGSIIVFIPTLGAYVTPDLLGGARVALLGNLLQQQFMTVRDWPFGSAIGFLMMAIMLAATLLYFRISAQSERL
jgi:spermidine/putrescine transport system permease protein